MVYSLHFLAVVTCSCVLMSICREKYYITCLFLVHLHISQIIDMPVIVITSTDVFRLLFNFMDKA